MKKRKVSPFGLVFGSILGIYTIGMILLFLWAVNASLKMVDQFDFDTIGLTKTFYFTNYEYAFYLGFNKSVLTNSGILKDVYIEQMFVNSLLYSMGSALCQTACTCITAYLITKYDNKFSKFMHNVIIVTMILPIVGATPSLIQVTDYLHIRNTFFGNYLMKFGFTNTYYLIFYGAFKSLSWGYAEAAFIDGAGHFQVFFKIMVPLVSTLFGCVFLIFFIQYWNDYQTPMLFLEKNPVLAWGLFEFFKSYEQELSTPTVKIAGGIIVLLPLLVLFMVFKKKLMGNLTEGGIKS